MDRSSGTRIPRSRQAARAPSAIWSLKQKIAVGAGATSRHAIAAAWPESTEKSPGTMRCWRSRPRALPAARTPCSRCWCRGLSGGPPPTASCS
ncbi:hypothetical protein G6F46_014433 [Rhizopus delemar]|nr:hypothetical protein G6F46_014433 [Rhizopus delemar]